MDMYHKGQSSRLPEGLTLGEPAGIGMPFHVDNFPEGLQDAFETEEQQGAAGDERNDAAQHVSTTMRSIERVTCMHCDKEQDFATYLIVNPDSNPRLREKILQCELTRLVCTECGESTNIGYPFLYHDMSNKYWFWCAVGEEEDQFPGIDQILVKAGIKVDAVYQDYHCRIVRDPIELSDKIHLFEDGMDDRITEIFKIYALTGRDELYGKNARSLYYTGTFAGALQFLSLGRKDAGMVGLRQQGYAELYEKFIDKLPDMSQLLGQYLRVDSGYALAFLEDIVNEKKDKASGGIFSRVTS